MILSAVTCNIALWRERRSRPSVIGSTRIARGSALRECGPSRSGCPTFGLQSSQRKRTDSQLQWPPPHVPPTIRRSSTLSARVRSEAGRDLDGRWRIWICREAATGGHRPGRWLGRHGFGNRLRFHDRPDGGATNAPAGLSRRNKRPPRAQQPSGRQTHHSPSSQGRKQDRSPRRRGHRSTWEGDCGFSRTRGPLARRPKPRRASRRLAWRRLTLQ